MSVNIKPLEDKIVVQASEAESTTASGLVIPDTAKEKPQEGKVLAVGPGRYEKGERIPLDVSVGDVVIYSKYGGTGGAGVTCRPPATITFRQPPRRPLPRGGGGGCIFPDLEGNGCRSN